jgi:hypothetical protein
VEEVVEATTCEHEREERARGRGGRLVVEGIDDAVFHCVLREGKHRGHTEEEEMRKDERKGREDIKDGSMEGMSLISTKRRLGRELWRCDSDEPVWCDVV